MGFIVNDIRMAQFIQAELYDRKREFGIYYYWYNGSIHPDVDYFFNYHMPGKFI